MFDVSAVSVLRPAHLERLRQPSKIVLVGGMCAGKSYLGRALIDALPRECAVVRRYTTRPRRQGDAEEDVVTVAWSEFRALVEQDQLLLSWERPVPDGTIIGYGCSRTAGDRLPVCMAGHGIYTNKASVRPIGALDDALVVGVAASYQVRQARLSRRSPDVVASGHGRVAALLQHDDALMARNVDLLVTNDGPNHATAPREFVAAIRDMLRAIGGS